MSEMERPRNEKEEKDEKDSDGWDEKWRRDPVDAAMWALILIWAGLVLLGANIGVFDQLDGVEAWAIGFFGAGVIVWLAAGFRLLVPAYRRPLAGRDLRTVHRNGSRRDAGHRVRASRRPRGRRHAPSSA